MQGKAVCVSTTWGGESGAQFCRSAWKAFTYEWYLAVL